MSAVLSAPAPMAFQGATRSLHQHQTKLRLTRAAWLAAASDNQPQDWSASCRAGFKHLISTDDTCRGLRGSGLFHSHRQGASLPHCRLVAERAFPAALAITIHHDHRGSRRTVMHSLSDQPIFQNGGYALHLSSLSSSAVSVGIDPNENGLTHAQASFAPGANAND